eukprot:Filipodium_phascolosomae@DN1625_c0_g1_i1.p1
MLGRKLVILLVVLFVLKDVEGAKARRRFQLATSDKKTEAKDVKEAEKKPEKIVSITKNDSDPKSANQKAPEGKSESEKKTEPEKKPENKDEKKAEPAKTENKDKTDQKATESAPATASLKDVSLKSLAASDTKETEKVTGTVEKTSPPEGGKPPVQTADKGVQTEETKKKEEKDTPKGKEGEAQSLTQTEDSSGDESEDEDEKKDKSSKKKPKAAKDEDKDKKKDDKKDDKKGGAVGNASSLTGLILIVTVLAHL